MKNIIKSVLSMIFPDKFILRRVRNSGKKIAITFDDGPHASNTMKLLNILSAGGAKASFFASGSEAERHPELIKEISSRGHEIGNHSYLHRRISDIGMGDYTSSIDKTSALIGYAPLFRPPYGEISLPLIKFILGSKLKYAGWTVDSRDSYNKNKEKLAMSMRNRKIASGDIILFHEDYDTTVSAMPDIIDDLKSRGFKLVTVSELQDKA